MVNPIDLTTDTVKVERRSPKLQLYPTSKRLMRTIRIRTMTDLQSLSKIALEFMTNLIETEFATTKLPI